MRQNLIFPLLAGCCLLISGCGDSHQQVTQESLKLLEKMATLVEGIETVQDAEAVRPELDQLAADLKVLRMRARNLGAPDADGDEQLKSRFGEAQREVSARLSQAFADLDPECRGVLAGSLVPSPQ